MANRTIKQYKWAAAAGNCRMRMLMTVLLLASLSSCKKFLQERSQSDFTPKSTTSFSELLMGTAYPLSTGRLHQAICLMDDDVQEYPPVTQGDVGDGYEQGLPAYAWQPDFFERMEASGFDPSGITIDGYKNYYKLITGTNIALQYGPESEGTRADKDYLLGQAYTLRAFYYFQLVNLYGRPYNDSTTTPEKSPGVPLILTANVSDSMPRRHSVQQVYRQVHSDLQQAFQMLDAEKRTGDIFRVDHIAAHLLASRVALYMCDWDSVIRHADYVIQYHPQLMNLNDWFPRKTDPSGNPAFLPIIGVGNRETIWTYSSSNETYPLKIAYAYGMSKDLVSQFEPTDLRAQIYFTTAPPIFEQWISILSQPAKWEIIGTIITTTGCAFRSSEAYLNRAEAYAQKYLLTGDASFGQKAMEDLNTLRKNRFSAADFQPLQAIPADSLLQFCRQERRREFFFEGHRWFDLRRYGMPSITHTYGMTKTSQRTFTLQAHDPQYTLQIPPTAILMNQNLIQNPAAPVRESH
ncbi:RagB/SusD family nutrient uptake outer membrane protein [Arachidicoccus terrestris]|uniref:RagB/SusD family nutrient uptake outer membrane protein n=1 Tax=Arachidicoccus terrestris TaxID=2875539 RepID=UPI001CC70357|nr:RagB/SusD family nutrient uptake outer membrane protein [Arachidicoccus terrestris]UAY55396.1 RagB/SusD family nutrient uptake outer membrane protein [Arachidicoccus terrestris]